MAAFATAVRCMSAAVLIFSCGAAAAAKSSPSPVDSIERASGAGDSAVALRSSSELLARTPVTDAAIIDVLQARLDVVADSGEWAALKGDLRATIERLPNAELRDAMLAAFDVADAAAATPTNAAVLLELAQRNLQKKFARPASFAAEMHGAAARAAVVQGRGEAADLEAQAALEFWHDAAGVRARKYEIAAELLLSQGAQLGNRGDEAIRHAETAGRIAVATFGSNSLARLRTDEQRAIVLESQERFAESRELREGILKATYALYGDHNLRTAQAEALLAAHLQTTGNYAPAREHFAIAESVMAGVTNASPRDRIILANNYANLLQEMGDENAALAHYRIALELTADNRTRAVILTNIGNTEFRLAHYDEAIANFNQALPLREQAEGKDSAGLSFALEGLGSSALALRNFADAEQYFARAVALRGKVSAPNHSHMNVLNFGLALAKWGSGDDAEAFRLAVQTAERQQSLLGALATGFSEQQSIAFDNLLVPATPLSVTIAAAHGDAAEIATAWRLVMVERGLIARAEARRLAIARASADPNLAQLYRDWRLANSALGDAWLGSKTSAQQLSQLQQAAETAERVLWTRLGFRQEDLVVASKPAADLARALPADGVLVAFSEGVAKDAARIVNAGAPQPAEDLYAFVLHPHGGPRLQRVGRIDALAAQTRAWYGGLRDPRSDSGQLRARGADLRRDLFGDISDFKSAQTLFVIPFGDLYRISFAALPAPAGDRYLIEAGVRVHTLSHESDLLLTAEPRHAVRALLAGAPEFGARLAPKVENDASPPARQVCAQAAERGFAPIPGAGRELEVLRGVLGDALGGSGDVNVIGGALATKEHVLAALPGADIIHIATHGFSFDASCGNGNARGVTLDARRSSIAPASPPLSGLAFSGADVSGGHAPVGVLSAGEMSAADLSHAGWVVLSSCDSGLGPIGRSEGVFGMRRALRLAGARTVVMSLWEADDTSTAELMKSLYRARFVQHRDVPDAMSQAMQETLAARRAAHESTHPYYWAAFIGEGGWR